MTSPFTTVNDQQQEAVEYLNVETAVQHLLVVRPLEYQQSGFKTEFKPEGTDVVFCDIADLDVIGSDGQPGKVYRRSSILQGYLKGTFKRYVGHTLIGMIYYGPRQKGQKAPYMWQDLTTEPAVVQRGHAWLMAHQDFLVPISTSVPEAPVVAGPPKYTPPASVAPQPAAPLSTLDMMRRANNGADADAAPF